MDLAYYITQSYPILMLFPDYPSYQIPDKLDLQLDPRRRNLSPRTLRNSTLGITLEPKPATFK
uniref:Uncharacterized protein n=2 Tax=Picea TaxID=3328 RepID=A0A117NFI2_PICGL|nr:hypothetical protein ABT39_MTgene3463 [Picea glauca]QHR92892.1 hypothetical protein Q903MT_gene6941 [Picea sitchensis]